MQIERQMLGACRRLAGKGFLRAPADSFSLRIPGSTEMILASGHPDWRQIEIADLRRLSFLVQEGICGLHASIYQQRADVGAVVISSPQGVRLLARYGGRLPPLFDEQVRHLGPSTPALESQANVARSLVRKAFRRGANAALFGEQLLSLGMTCERVLCNTELYEKCARAYLIARASGGRIGFIPLWVRVIANRRLLRDERRASASYRDGHTPQGINAY